MCPRPDPFNVNNNKGYNRAALIKFSSYVNKEFDFAAMKNLADLQASIKAIRYRGGSTCTGNALEKAIQMFTPSKGARSGTRHEVLILTDGHSNCGKHLSTVLPRLHAKATVFGLMIGRHSSSGKQELTSYVSKPKPNHLFAVDNYQDLKQLVTLIKAQIVSFEIPENIIELP
ncbi:COL12A [Mytilus edulis]|uniref:COL12A n=1 Tax=Mytilus edulis TaxID=6550 RepID=A0A8S3S0Z0_MYTED|nr:COL12A [Mytilus edulis]